MRKIRREVTRKMARRSEALLPLPRLGPLLSAGIPGEIIAFPRRVSEKRDPRVKGPKSDLV
jgi:hypothetical protein